MDRVFEDRIKRCAMRLVLFPISQMEPAFFFLEMRAGKGVRRPVLSCRDGPVSQTIA